MGFWQRPVTTSLGGDKLEEMLISGELKIPCMTIVNELHTWIWNKRGIRDHASGKHDDILMALTMAMFYVHYVLIRRASLNKMTKEHFEFRREMTVVKNSMGTEDIFNDLLDGDKQNLDRLSPKQNYDKRQRRDFAVFST